MLLVFLFLMGIQLFSYLFMAPEQQRQAQPNNTHSKSSNKDYNVANQNSPQDKKDQAKRLFNIHENEGRSSSSSEMKHQHNRHSSNHSLNASDEDLGIEPIELHNPNEDIDSLSKDHLPSIHSVSHTNLDANLQNTCMNEFKTFISNMDTVLKNYTKKQLVNGATYANDNQTIVASFTLNTSVITWICEFIKDWDDEFYAISDRIIMNLEKFSRTCNISYDFVFWTCFDVSHTKTQDDFTNEISEKYRSAMAFTIVHQKITIVGLDVSFPIVKEFFCAGAYTLIDSIKQNRNIR